MKQYQFISHNETDTMNFAQKLAAKLKFGDIIVLNGDLGAGKTKFTEGVLTYFGLADEIASPTFTIVNEYKSSSVTIFHFDVYRLEDENEFYEIGGEEYFENGICLIEWGNIIHNALPNHYIEINFERNNENSNDRILTIQTHGDRFEAYFEEELF